MTDTGTLPPYAQEPAEVAVDVDDTDVDVDDTDSEEVEDGLQGSREPAARAVAARLSRRPRDMVISIGLLLVIVFALFRLYRCLGGNQPARVNPAPAFEQARNAKAFQMLKPSRLPSG